MNDRNEERAWALLLLFVVLDAVTTWYGLVFVDGIVEKNPVVVHAIEYFGLVPSMVILKVFGLGFLYFVYRTLYGAEIEFGYFDWTADGTEWAYASLFAWLLVHVGVVASNVYQLYLAFTV